jgi:hypothetical protein
MTSHPVGAGDSEVVTDVADAGLPAMLVDMPGDEPKDGFLSVSQGVLVSHAHVPPCVKRKPGGKDMASLPPGYTHTRLGLD